MHANLHKNPNSGELYLSCVSENDNDRFAAQHFLQAMGIHVNPEFDCFPTSITVEVKLSQWGEYQFTLGFGPARRPEGPCPTPP